MSRFPRWSILNDTSSRIWGLSHALTPWLAQEVGSQSVNLSLQEGGHCWPSVVRQNATQAPVLSPLAVASLVCCWLRMLSVPWHSSSLSSPISRVSLHFQEVVFFFTYSFPGSSIPNLNSLYAEAEYVISLLSGLWCPFMNWRMQDMPSVFKPGIIDIYRSIPWPS